jgi:hypothetical protein
MMKRVIDVLIVVAVLVASASGTPLGAQDSSPNNVDLRLFVGTWRENQSKSHPFISPAFTYTFTAEPDGFITIVRGKVQLRDRVRMDGTDYPTPDIPGRSVSWTKVSNTMYQNTIKQNGNLLGTARWTISDGGMRLTQETTPVRANGQNDMGVIEYLRVSGERDSLFGEWKPISTRTALPDLFSMTLNDDELRAFYPKYGAVIYTVRLDGKQYPLTGPTALPGAMTAAEALGTRSLRHITFLNGKPSQETVMSVSTDGMAMTVTTHTPGSADEASMFVYERQDGR